MHDRSRILTSRAAADLVQDGMSTTMGGKAAAKQPYLMYGQNIIVKS
jgi:hypothetical protein